MAKRKRSGKLPHLLVADAHIIRRLEIAVERLVGQVNSLEALLAEPTRRAEAAAATRAARRAFEEARARAAADGVDLGAAGAAPLEHLPLFAVLPAGPAGPDSSSPGKEQPDTEG